MEKRLTRVTPEVWEFMRKKRKSLMIELKRPDWMFEVAGLYQKGEIELYLCPVPPPGIKILQVKPLTREDWEFALTQAQKLLRTLARSVSDGNGAHSPEFLNFPDKGVIPCEVSSSRDDELPLYQEGFHDPDSGKGGDSDG